jgi:hypothetical protein
MKMTNLLKAFEVFETEEEAVKQELGVRSQKSE